ncbi:WD40 domain-containing protein [Naegleria gruberi]|uniref:WD40 domain-containing protein n=1 Tax=Naegleria gruberi TaxID=5762 RepID=D2VTQ9_NAEGR|nr:WD40 domain-containing protein [Naegleria gruberi]EFC39697.1 WD40 domain-containing protein [Naegleria gruberi]|eukprot:XP_002672441.1 WD40 domain-containing protein [Naegleria gruberi strain NEG-M]
MFLKQWLNNKRSNSMSTSSSSGSISNMVNTNNNQTTNPNNSYSSGLDNLGFLDQQTSPNSPPSSSSSQFTTSSQSPTSNNQNKGVSGVVGDQSPLLFNPPNNNSTINNEKSTIMNTSTYYTYTVQSEEGLPSMAQHHHLDDVSSSDENFQSPRMVPLHVNTTPSSSNNHHQHSASRMMQPNRDSPLIHPHHHAIRVFPYDLRKFNNNQQQQHISHHQYSQLSTTPNQQQHGSEELAVSVSPIPSNLMMNIPEIGLSPITSGPNKLLNSPHSPIDDDHNNGGGISPKSDEEVSVSLFSGDISKAVHDEYYPSPQKLSASRLLPSEPPSPTATTTRLGDSFNSQMHSPSVRSTASNVSTSRRRANSNSSNISSTMSFQNPQQNAPFIVYSLKNQSLGFMNTAISHHCSNRNANHHTHNLCEECTNCNIARNHTSPFSEVSVINMIDPNSSLGIGEVNNINKVILLYDRNVNLDTSYACLTPYFFNYWNYANFCNRNGEEVGIPRIPPHQYFSLNEEFMFYRCRPLKVAPNNMVSSPMLTCYEDGRISVWDATNSKRVANLNGHRLTITCAVPIFAQGTLISQSSEDSNLYFQYTPFAQFLLTGSGDKSIKLWDISAIWSTSGQAPTFNLNPVRTMNIHESSVRCIELLNDGSPRFCSASNDGKICLWNWFTGELLQVINRREDGCISNMFIMNSMFYNDMSFIERTNNTIVSTCSNKPDLFIYDFEKIEDVIEESPTITDDSSSNDFFYKLIDEELVPSATTEPSSSASVVTQPPITSNKPKNIISSLKILNIFSMPSTSSNADNISQKSDNSSHSSMTQSMNQSMNQSPNQSNPTLPAKQSEFDYIISTVNNFGELTFWKTAQIDSEAKWNKLCSCKKIREILESKYSSNELTYQACIQLVVNNHFLLVSLANHLFIFDIADILMHTEGNQECKFLLEQAEAHSSTITTMCTLHYGHIIATGAEDGTIRLWDTGKLLISNNPYVPTPNPETASTTASSILHPIESIFIGTSKNVQTAFLRNIATLQMHSQAIVSLQSLNEYAFISVAKGEPFALMWKDSRMEKKLRGYYAFHYGLGNTDMLSSGSAGGYNVPNMLSLMLGENNSVATALNVTPFAYLSMVNNRQRSNSGMRKVQSVIGFKNPGYGKALSPKSSSTEDLTVNTQREKAAMRAFTTDDERLNKDDEASEALESQQQDDYCETCTSEVSTPVQHSRTDTVDSEKLLE